MITLFVVIVVIPIALLHIDIRDYSKTRAISYQT